LRHLRSMKALCSLETIQPRLSDFFYLPPPFSPECIFSLLEGQLGPLFYLNVLVDLPLLGFESPFRARFCKCNDFTSFYHFPLRSSFFGSSPFIPFFFDSPKLSFSIGFSIRTLCIPFITIFPFSLTSEPSRLFPDFLSSWHRLYFPRFAGLDVWLFSFSRSKSSHLFLSTWFFQSENFFFFSRLRWPVDPIPLCVILPLFSPPVPPSCPLGG